MVEKAYRELLNLKSQEVFAEMDAAMAEICRSASANQQDVVDMATKAFAEKGDAANAARSLTALDAMKIQIANLRQKYLKALVVAVEPDIKAKTVNRIGLCTVAKLESEADVDKYVADLRAKLLEMLEGNDVLHII